MTISEMEEYKKSFDKLKSKDLEFIIFPPLLYLSMFKKTEHKVGTQNFFSYNMGSFTGEISLEQLKEINVKYTLVGHYERRKIMFESYAVSKEKLYKSLKSKFNTILCIGEPKKTNKPFNYVKKELNFYLRNIESSNIKYLSIAYEPNWAVGSGQVQSIDKISKTINRIKKYVYDKYQFDIEVYYGGSIDKDNVKEILEVSDGIILGKKSIYIDEIKDMISLIDK